MDGHGLLSDDTIKNVLLLTNIALIHLHADEAEDACIVNELKQLILTIKNIDKSIIVMVLVRDAAKSEILRGHCGDLASGKLPFGAQKTLEK